MGNEGKRSESGNSIYVYSATDKKSSPVFGSSEDVDLIENHISRHVGHADYVWHELISDLVHIDVHWVKPTHNRNVHTLVTTGMSDLPMTPPVGAEEFKYSELMITLPAGWRLSDTAFREEKNYWPIRLLKSLARFPHEYSTWLWQAHTVPNGEPPRPYDPSTGFVGAIIAPPITLSPDFLTLRCNPDQKIHFSSVIPLYPEEMELKLKKGAEALFDLFDKHSVDETIDVHRVNTAKKKWWQLG